MSKKHFLLYDFLLPLAGILLIGSFLSERFDGGLFHRLDSIKAFGLGFVFSHSELRATLLRSSWLIFASIPAAAWMVWVRINLEFDYLQQRRRIDRPIFNFFQALSLWIEDGGQAKRERQALEVRLAQAHDHIHRIEAELSAARTRPRSRSEWPDDVMPPARRQG
jgi:hypothetical protein